MVEIATLQRGDRVKVQCLDSQVREGVVVGYQRDAGTLTFITVPERNDGLFDGYYTEHMIVEVVSHKADETVLIDITIKIDTSGPVDTGLSVEAWNALTDEERDARFVELWNDTAANADKGGMRVITFGATEI